MSTPTPLLKKVRRRTLVLALTGVLVLLVITVAGGAELYTRKAYSDCISTQFEKQMGSGIDVGFGAKPMLLSALDGRIGKITVDSENDQFGPAMGMDVHAEFHDLEVADHGRAGGTVGSSEADVRWDNEGIAETLGGGLVSGVQSSASTGLITLDVIGGLAQLEVRPLIDDGTVTVETTSAALLGLGLPTDLVQSIVDSLTESLSTYPMNMQATELKVTDDGLQIRLEGGHAEFDPDDPAFTDAYTATEVQC